MNAGSKSASLEANVSVLCLANISAFLHSQLYTIFLIDANGLAHVSGKKNILRQGLR
jgi:hypothetical protein